MAVSEKTYRRAELASLIGLVLQVAGFVLVYLTSMADQAPSVFIESWHWLGGVLIWVLLLVIFHQKRLESLEELELDELRRQRDQSGQNALFEVEAEDMLVAGRRLKVIMRYVMPVAALALVAYHVAIGAWCWMLVNRFYPLNAECVGDLRWVRPSMALLAVLAFFGFIVSRVLIGIAKDPACRMLRAGATYLAGNYFVVLALVIVLGVADFGWRTPELVAARVLPILLIVLGIELVFNLILEIYRPRIPGSPVRPVLESRLLGLISEPGDVARSIADAMNYQFGFEISRTWFYQLLQKALGPLILFQISALLALTVFVFVEPGQRAIVERFGQFRSETLEPGLHFKWPWPVEQAHIVDTDRIREVLLGTASDAHGDYHDTGEVVLWTAEHGHGHEYDLLVAPPADMQYRAETARRAATTQPDAQTRSVAVNLLRVVGLLRYRVSDPVQYLYNYADSDEVLSQTIQEAFLRFAASRDSDQLMTAERYKVNQELRQELAEQIERMDPPLGVELVDASLVGVHPPPAVADAYEMVGSGELIRAQMVARARTYSNAALSNLAGSSALAVELAKAIDAVDQLDGDRSSDRAEQARKRLIDLLALSGGQVSQIINSAEAERTDRENRSLADVAGFKAKLKAYNEAPHLFAASEYLDAMARVLLPVRKYLVATSTGDLPFVVTFDMKDSGELFGMGGARK